MKILGVKTLRVPEIRVIRFARFSDVRGYFTETYREGDFQSLDCMRGVKFVQHNESHSKEGAIRGMHFQWNPYMGKLVRTVKGRMIDLALDVRKDSPNFGCMLAYDMPSRPNDAYGEWIWVPPGFAHGNVFTEDTTIEYLCTGEYNKDCEASISPLAADIDWSICDSKLANEFHAISEKTRLITDKDRNGLTVGQWRTDCRSEHFLTSKFQVKRTRP